jgi:hypothetical protein
VHLLVKNNRSLQDCGYTAVWWWLVGSWIYIHTHTRLLTRWLCSFKNKSKRKVHPITSHEGPEGEKGYSSTLSLTSSLDGLGGQRHAPAALPPGKIRYPKYEAGRVAGHVWTGVANLASTGIRSLDRPSRSISLYRLQ